MRKRQPQIGSISQWLVSDARNDAALETALARMPRGSGLIFRHYHLPLEERRARFARLVRAARARGHVVVLAGSMAQARTWGGDGAYGPAALVAPGARGLRLMTAHSPAEIRRAARADAVLLSPVFATRSHPGACGLGAVKFRAMAALCPMPVVALGGMDARRARALRWPRWAAIDGLTPAASGGDS